MHFFRIDDGECENYMQICCGFDDVTDVPITPTPPPIISHGCGRRNPDGVGFRMTGDKDGEAQFGEFPWMAAILHEETIEGFSEKLSVYKCGGSLVNQKVVITAAHCVDDNKKYKVRLGEWDTQIDSEIFPNKEVNVETIIIHPNYKSKVLFNDIAILILTEPVTITENIDVTCLPTSNSISTATECYTTGWGKDSFGKDGKYQVILKKIELPIVNRNKCQQQLRQTRLGKYFRLDPSFICAGGEEGKDACKGDGGSPLVCAIPGHPDRYEQVGIVAWGIGCGEKDIPGVYVNVAMFRSWIDQQLKNHNIDVSSYIY